MTFLSDFEKVYNFMQQENIQLKNRLKELEEQVKMQQNVINDQREQLYNKTK